MTGRTLAFATALCGGLAIVYAAVLTLLRGGNVGVMLRGVASGPFGDAGWSWSASGAAAGLAVHFAIMAATCAVGLALLSREPFRTIAAWKTGTLYGLVLYCAMYGVILPWRIGVPFPNPDRVELALGLLPHVFLVGIPLALLAGGRLFRRKRAIS